MRSAALTTSVRTGTLAPPNAPWQQLRNVWRRGRGTTVVAMSAAGSWNKDVPSSTMDCDPPRTVMADRPIGLQEKPPLGTEENKLNNVLEELIEKIIFKFRFFTLLGVSGSLVGSMLCFFKGCVIVVCSFLQYLSYRGRVVQMLIEAIDVYLLGTVMLVFGMGLYELFICNLDIAKISTSRSNLFGLFMLQERPKWLEIKSVDELKTKLGHVIVMVLMVGLFEKSTKVVIASPMDLLYFSASILFSSCGLYLLFKLRH